MAGSIVPLSACSTMEETILPATATPVSPDVKLKVGLVGCGGRGTGAANQALSADPNVELVALGDLFPDQIERSVEQLSHRHADKMDVPEERKFTGFDCYQKVIDSGVDVVLLAAPPAFRPAHLKYAVDAGVHSFCEKPVAVDAPGVRSILDSVKKSKEKDLSVVSGFCWRYHNAKRAFFQQINDGGVGEIRTVYNTYLTGSLWYRDRQPDWNDKEYQMRNWLYYNWISGDHIVEQAVHSIDFMSWAMGDEMPESVIGTGGRQVRTDERYGNIYDHFAITYQYANGAKGFHFCRQQPNCENSYKAEVFGSDGIGRAFASGIEYSINGSNPWEYDGEINDMYQTQHDELFEAIRTGRPINDGELMANSTMLGIMGRMAAYTGRKITWEEAMNSTEKLGPDHHDWDTIPDATALEVAMPGVTRFS